jgi:polysaccharide biosynthesis protein PslH
VESHLPVLLGNRSYDVAQAESSAIWPVLADVAASAKILVLHDDDARRYLRIAGQVRDPRRKAARLAAALKYRRFQAQAIRDADRVWCVSEAELQRLAGTSGKFVLVPNGASAGFFDVPVGRSDERRIATFVGPATYDANRRAVDHFVREIWPLVRKRVPNSELRLVGRGWQETAQRTAAVTDRGWVEDLPAEVGRAAVVVAPLLDGGGTKIKVVEAMAAARPVVATSVAVEGIPESPGLRVAGDAGAFAIDVARFLSDAGLAREAGQANRAAVAGLEWSEIWRRAMADIDAVRSGRAC